MNNFKKVIFSTLSFLAVTLSLSAQTTDQVEMADVFHTNGKIYVVVTVLAVVFIGLVIFLMRIDRKVSRLEKDMKIKKD